MKKLYRKTIKDIIQNKDKIKILKANPWGIYRCVISGKEEYEFWISKETNKKRLDCFSFVLIAPDKSQANCFVRWTNIYLYFIVRQLFKTVQKIELNKQEYHRREGMEERRDESAKVLKSFLNK